MYCKHNLYVTIWNWRMYKIKKSPIKSLNSRPSILQEKILINELVGGNLCVEGGKWKTISETSRLHIREMRVRNYLFLKILKNLDLPFIFPSWISISKYLWDKNVSGFLQDFCQSFDNIKNLEKFPKYFRSWSKILDGRTWVEFLVTFAWVRE